MITKFICKECKQSKTEVWLVCDPDHGDFWCESCRERSKREDSLLKELLESCPGNLDISEAAEAPLVWDKDLNFIGYKVLEEMRCSEHCGNTVRDK